MRLPPLALAALAAFTLAGTAQACDLEGFDHTLDIAIPADELERLGRFAEAADVRAREAAFEVARRAFLSRFGIEFDTPAPAPFKVATLASGADNAAEDPRPDVSDRGAADSRAAGF